MKVIWIPLPVSDLMFCEEGSGEQMPFVILSWETATRLSGTVAKILPLLQPVSACQVGINGVEGRSLASFNFAYFHPDFIKLWAHYLKIVRPLSPGLEFQISDL